MRLQASPRSSSPAARWRPDGPRTGSTVHRPPESIAFVAGVQRQSGQIAPPRAGFDREGGLLPDLRLLLRHVHGQQHELPGPRRSAWHSPATWDDPRHLGRPPQPLQAGGRADRRHGPRVRQGRPRSRPPAGASISLLGPPSTTRWSSTTWRWAAARTTLLHLLAIAHTRQASPTRWSGSTRPQPASARTSASGGPFGQSTTSRTWRGQGNSYTILGEVERGRPGLLDLSCPDRDGQDVAPGREHRRI